MRFRICGNSRRSAEHKGSNIPTADGRNSCVSCLPAPRHEVTKMAWDAWSLAARPPFSGTARFIRGQIMYGKEAARIHADRRLRRRARPGKMKLRSEKTKNEGIPVWVRPRFVCLKLRDEMLRRKARIMPVCRDGILRRVTEIQKTYDVQIIRQSVRKSISTSFYFSGLVDSRTISSALNDSDCTSFCGCLILE